MTSKLVIEKNHEFPRGWVSSNLGGFLTPVKGKKPKTLGEKNSTCTIPYINIKAFEKNIIEQYTNDTQCPQCSEEDVLMVWDGARSGLVGTGIKGAIGSTLSKLLIPYINSKYLFYFLQSKYHFINKNTKGVGIPHVNPNILANIEFPIPPLNEQKRIVNKIEAIFSELDFSKQILEETKILLKQQRQSLLKFAFKGKLTEKWRIENKNKIESSFALLEKIKKIEENKKAHLISSDELYKLPDEWLWNNVYSIASVQTGPFGTQLHKSDYADSGISVIEIGDVHPNRNLSDGSAHYVSEEKAKQLTRFAVQKNDILFTRVGTVGRCTIVPEECTGWLMSTSLIRVRTLDDFFNSKFLFYYFISPIAQHFSEKTSKGTTRMGTNSKIVGNLPIIITSKEEQKQVVLKIEESFSLIENYEKTILFSLKNIEVMKKSVLNHAFQGKLVSQDPNDEPASLLIGKIKQKMVDKK